MNLKGKVAVVTGSSSGIGEAIAFSLAKEGVKVVVNSRKNVIGGNKVVEEIKKEDGDAIYVKADLSDPNDAKRLFKEAVRKYKKVDILVNNAGESKGSEFGDLKVWDYQFKNVLLSQVIATNEFISLKNVQEFRKIVNISSIYGLGLGSDFRHVAYGAMKAAVNSMTVDLARKFGKKILVNAIAPGYTWTPPWGKITWDLEENMKRFTKIDRFVATEEISEMVMTVLKNDAIVGQVITIDGGATLIDLY